MTIMALPRYFASASGVTVNAEASGSCSSLSPRSTNETLARFLSSPLNRAGAHPKLLTWQCTPYLRTSQVRFYGGVVVAVEIMVLSGDYGSFCTVLYDAHKQHHRSNNHEYNETTQLSECR